MNIKDYAEIIIKMDSRVKRNEAIAKLEHGLKHEEKWDAVHKSQVRNLITFLASYSNNIDDLEKYCPVS